MSGSAEVEQAVADGEGPGGEAEPSGRRFTLRRAAPPATSSPAPVGDTMAGQPTAPVTTAATATSTALDPGTGLTTADKGDAEPTAKKDGTTATVTGKDDDAAADPDSGGDAGIAIGPRWDAFAPPEERRPSRIRRSLGAAGLVLLHEWTVVSLGGLLLAALMTWPTLRHPTRTIPQDIWDPTLQAWQMAWSGHALKTDPTGLWQSNTFFPERYTFAFSDTLLGYVPFGLIGTGPT